MAYNLFLFNQTGSGGEYNKKQSSKTKFRHSLPGYMLIRIDKHLQTMASGPDITPRKKSVGVSACVSRFFLNDAADKLVKGYLGKNRKDEMILTPSVFQSKSPGKINQLLKDVFHQRAF